MLFNEFTLVYVKEKFSSIYYSIHYLSKISHLIKRDPQSIEFEMTHKTFPISVVDKSSLITLFYF